MSTEHGASCSRKVETAPRAIPTARLRWCMPTTASVALRSSSSSLRPLTGFPTRRLVAAGCTAAVAVRPLLEREPGVGVDRLEHVASSIAAFAAIDVSSTDTSTSPPSGSERRAASCAATSLSGEPSTPQTTVENTLMIHLVRSSEGRIAHPRRTQNGGRRVRRPSGGRGSTCGNPNRPVEVRSSTPRPPGVPGCPPCGLRRCSP